jgi:hypothetical protein
MMKLKSKPGPNQWVRWLFVPAGFILFELKTALGSTATLPFPSPEIDILRPIKIHTHLSLRPSLLGISLLVLVLLGFVVFIVTKARQKRPARVFGDRTQKLLHRAKQLVAKKSQDESYLVIADACTVLLEDVYAKDFKHLTATELIAGMQQESVLPSAIEKSLGEFLLRLEQIKYSPQKETSAVQQDLIFAQKLADSVVAWAKTRNPD